MQCTHSIAMVRPAAFGFNEETALTNFFQDATQNNNLQLQQLALQQFDDMVMLLRNHGIEVLVLADNAIPVKRDAIFPNNWFSCNDDVLYIYPMCAQSRQAEKRLELIEILQQKTAIQKIIDWSHYEKDGLYLEGTGSMIIDHVHRNIYACVSARTNEGLFLKFCKENNYKPLLFAASDQHGNAIYHTNVMMCIGARFAVICLDAIPGDIERKIIIHELETTGHEIIAISFEQMNQFAGNMLQLINKAEKSFLVMSAAAKKSLTNEQLATLENYACILAPDVSHIEKAAGGSVRCMMAELFY